MAFSVVFPWRVRFVYHFEGREEFYFRARIW
jgi:hypothetical protein